MGKVLASPARRRSLAYAALFIGLLAIRVPVGRLNCAVAADIHTLLETTVTLLSFVVGALALVRYYSQKATRYLILGSGFLGASLLNGFHLAASTFCADCTASLSYLVPWTGALSRLFLSMLMCASLFVGRSETGGRRKEALRERRLYLLVGAWTLMTLAILLWPGHPQVYRPDWPVHRPAELIAGIFFFIAFLGYLWKGDWKTDGFAHCVVLFLIVATLGQIVYMAFSARFLDGLNLTAHFLKLLGYAFVLSGLLSSMSSIFRNEAEAVRSLTRANGLLEIEIEERQRAETKLQQSRDEMEARVVARTADLAEQAGLVALVSEIAVLLTHGEGLQESLRRSAELMVLFLDAAFVRIWTLNKSENVLELQASAGMYTHLDGPHARVPVGQMKIGRIAQEGQPHWTNNLPEDPWVSDSDWAKRQGMVAFAGSPLLVGEEVVGVVAAFARRPLNKGALQTFGSLAGSIAQFIGRKRMETALQESEERVRLLLDSTAEAIYGIDLEGNCTFANRAAVRVLGYENAADLLTENMHNLVHHTRADGSAYPLNECCIYQAFRKGARVRVADEVLWRKDGTSFPAEYWSYPVSKDGEVVGAVVTFLDITERKRAEDSLRSSEERFRIAAENASDMTFELDLRTGQLDYFGLSCDQLGDQPAPRSFEIWKSMVHPDDLGPILEAIPRHVESGERYIGEYRVPGENGRMYHYSLRGQAIRNRAGQSNKIVGLLVDITERKKAEQAISQLAAIVQGSEDAIIGTSLSGTITTWNGGAERLLGYCAPEALGASFSMLFHQPDQAWNILEPSSRGAVSRLDEAVFLCKEGLEIPVSLTVSPIRMASGEITGVATIARDISARKKAEIELAHQAQHDHLTGLPNPLLLADRLAAGIQRARRSGSATAVIYVDLDGFKFVNDTLGHEAGDALLKEVTVRLQACLRELDTLARMGGDEFMVVVNEVREDEVAQAIAERLRTALHRPFQVGDHELYVTASMGIAMYPRDGTDVSTLRRNADAAMYEAKRSGKDRVLFFRPAMGATFLEHLELETELRHALDRDNELSLVFQPIFRAQGGQQTAFEALLRWAHPLLGPIPPGKFVPVAEESGLIFRLGAWVLKQACRQCLLWQSHGLAGVRVAANVSALEFARAEFADDVLRVLEETGLPENLLDLEVTETTLMRDMDESISKMSLLRARGIRISIDDFGTGYSSLGYLPRLPVDTLKIDRSFVADLGGNSTARSLIEGMISLAHSIGKQVVVEGVETEEQLEILRRIGCDEIQGFLLGRPAALPTWKLPRLDGLETVEPAEISA